MEEMQADYDHVISVINSCRNVKHLEIAQKMALNFYRKHEKLKPITNIAMSMTAKQVLLHHNGE